MKQGELDVRQYLASLDEAVRSVVVDHQIPAIWLRIYA